MKFEKITLYLIKKIKEEKYISQVDFAKKVNVTPAAITKWLNGGNITIDKIPLICNALNVTPNELFGIYDNSIYKKIEIYPELKALIQNYNPNK